MPTKNLGLQLLSLAGEQQAELTNRNAFRIDVGGNYFIINSDTVATPPGSPTAGDAYILPSGGNQGLWSAFSQHDIAFFDGNSWFRIVPKEGQQAFIQSSDTFKYYNGSAWAAVPTSSVTTILGLNDVQEADFNGHSGEVLVVNADEDAMVFAAAGGATVFTGLNDVTPNNYTGADGKFVKVNGTNLEFANETSTFLALSDTPPSITNGQFVKGTGSNTVVFAAPSIAELAEASSGLSVPNDTNQFLKSNGSQQKLVFGQPSILQMSDTPNSMGSDGQVLKVSSGSLVFASDNTGAGGGGTTFIGLDDTPTNFNGSALFFARCNAIAGQPMGGNGNAIEFVEPNLTLNDDFPNTYAANANQILKVNGGASGVEFGATFLNLVQTPNTYGTAGQVVTVNGTGNGLIFADASGSGAATTWNDLTDCEDFGTGDINKKVVTNGGAGGGSTTPTGIAFEDDTFITLNDTPNNYTGHGAKILRVTGSAGADGSGIDFQTPSQLGIVLNDLQNVDAVTNLANDKILKYNATAAQWQVQDDGGSGGGGSSTFLGLQQTPDNFTGDAYKYLRVNAGNGTNGTAVEFIDQFEIKDIYIEYPNNDTKHCILRIPFAFQVVELLGRVSSGVAGGIALFSADNTQTSRSLTTLTAASQTLVSGDNLKTLTLNSNAASIASGRGLSVQTSNFPETASDLQLMIKIRRL